MANFRTRISYEEATLRAKLLREQLYRAIIAGQINPGESDSESWLSIVADAFYAVSEPLEEPPTVVRDRSTRSKML